MLACCTHCQSHCWWVRFTLEALNSSTESFVFHQIRDADAEHDLSDGCLQEVSVSLILGVIMGPAHIHKNKTAVMKRLN